MKTEKEIKDIQEEYRPHVIRLNKMMLNIYSISNIRYWYWCLSHFKKSPNVHEDLMQMDAITTSIVIAYGRLFSEGTGTTVLNKKAIPKDLRQIHDNIIDLRHARYAHHGVHDTMETKVHIEFNGSSFVITPTMNIVFCFGAPKEWEILFKWLDEYMHELIHEKLNFLTIKTGVKWEIPDRPAPYWV